MQIDKDELLNQAKDLLKEEVTQIAYDTWFRSLEIVEMTDTNIVLRTTSPYNQELLEARYADLILNTFKYIGISIPPTAFPNVITTMEAKQWALHAPAKLK